jgi:hypothetical protein
MAALELVVEVDQIILHHTFLYFHRPSFMLTKSTGFNSEVLDSAACLSCQLSLVALYANPF